MSKSVALIFGGEAKVKIMRLFVFNQGQNFDIKDVCDRTKERTPVVKRELGNLVKAGLLKKRGKQYSLNSPYVYRAAVENFLIDASPLSPKEIVRRLSKVGSLKLVLISGAFLHDKEARADILVVADHLRQAALSSAISHLESQLGKEIRYAAFETTDFKYRLGIYDKLVRDILDHPHQKIVSKLAI